MTENQYQRLLDGLTQINLRIDRMDQRIDHMDQRMDRMDQRMDRMDQRFDDMEQQFGRMDQRSDRMDRSLAQVNQRMDGFEQRLDRMDETIRESHAETRRHFGVVAEHLERKIGLVAEGLVSLEQRVAAGQRETAAEFAQVRSEIRLAYTALDLRISTLENAAGT